MNTNSLISRTLAVALSLAGAGAVAAELTTIAQVGAPAGGGEHYVAVLLRDNDGGLPPSGHTLFRDTGAGFGPVAQLVPTTNVTALALILQRAEAAGLDNLALERAVDALGGEPAPAGTLAERLSYVLRGEFSDNGSDTQKALLVRVFPQVAMACGAGWIGKTQSASPTTFELRESGGAGKVVGRVTTGIAPAVLPAPGGVGEVPAPDPTGHLRIYLNWWTTPALRDRTPHLCGYNVYRADRAHHISETGSPPPANYTPAALEAAIAAGLVVRVNACPILPDTLYEAAPPADAPHFFVDDNDTAELSRFDDGGAPFDDGQEMTYYVAACDYFGRAGNTSDGLETKACDRLPPGAPEQLHAEQVYQNGEAFVRLSWRKDPEVGRYLVYAYQRPDEALPDLRHPAAPETPNFLGYVLPEVDDEVLVSFLHDGAGRLQLPADAGKTLWYCVRAEDQSSCIDAEGFGNLSVPCGTIPASIYGFQGLAAPNGHLLTRCCDLLVSLQAPPATGDDGTPLQATRNDSRIRWVEFREVQNGTDFGRYEFGGSNSIETFVDVSDLPPPVQFSARFGLSSGYVGEWVNGPVQSGSPPHGESWRALLRCGDLEFDRVCETFPRFPIDPGSGATEPTCGVFNQQPGEHSWRVFRRVGQNGKLSLVASGKFEDADMWCVDSTPVHLPVTLCYYGQTFTQDGDPSPMALLGCIHFADGDQLPRPDITTAAVVPGSDVLAPTATAEVEWFCPRPGVERFDLAVFPIPPGAPQTLNLGGIVWGLYPSDRLPNGFGGSGSVFSMNLEISKGQNYTARVRARGLAPVAHPQMMAWGPWSTPKNIIWTPEENPQPGVLPWPSRQIPPVVPALWPAELDFESRGRVAIGLIPVEDVVNFDSSGAEVRAKSLRPYLFKPLPLVVYRHETSADARGEMAQVSPLIETFWEPIQTDTVRNNHAFVAIEKRDGAAPNDPFYIWVRDYHPLTLDKSYRYTVTCFGGDGEITGSVASAGFTASN